MTAEELPCHRRIDAIGIDEAIPRSRYRATLDLAGGQPWSGTTKENIMADTDSSVESATDQVKIALNTLYLCLESAVRHIEEAESPAEASEFKAGLLEQVKDGRIDMALLEDSALYDFIVPKLEPLLSR